MVDSPIVILGGGGQVARALADQLQDQAVSLTQTECDLTQLDQLPHILKRYRPSAIINAAAYTAVDQAEQEEELAYTINGRALMVLAEFAFRQSIPLVHYSTDYVFDGSKNGAWVETDVPSPLNAYGRTKLAGEQAILEQAKRIPGAKFLIFRTSWVYDAEGKNFLNTMLRLGAERETLSVVSDQVGAPTFAGDIARVTVNAMRSAGDMAPYPSGIYHLTNAGETNWHQFAERIFWEAQQRGQKLAVRLVNPIPTSAYPTPARRPANSRLDCTLVQNRFKIRLPAWQDALARVMDQKYGNQTISHS